MTSIIFKKKTKEEIESELNNLSGTKLKNYLRSLDWTIKNANMEKFTHNIHIYPARMVPDLVRRLIISFSIKGEKIFDPFCGSGTIILETMLLERQGIGSEINPLAVKIAQMKTSILSLEKIKQDYNKIVNTFNSNNFENYKLVKPEKFKGQIKWVNHWFEPQVQEQLYRLGESIKLIRDQGIREFFEIIYSNTSRNVSNNRNSSYKNYKMDGKSLENYDPEVFKIFQQYYLNGKRGMRELNEYISTKQVFKPRIECINFLDYNIAPNSVDLIVTSPPYGDSTTTVGYGQFSKFSLAWLDMNISIGSSVDREGLGGKKKELNDIHSQIFYKTKNKVKNNEINLKNQRNEDLHLFFSDYQSALINLAKILGPNRFICLILGNRTMREIQIPMDKISQDILQYLGFDHWLTIYRNIPNKRHPNSQLLYVDPKWKEVKNLNIKPVKIDNIGKESIVIMRKI